MPQWLSCGRDGGTLKLQNFIAVYATEYKFPNKLFNYSSQKIFLISQTCKKQFNCNESAIQ